MAWPGASPGLPKIARSIARQSFQPSACAGAGDDQVDVDEDRRVGRVLGLPPGRAVGRDQSDEGEILVGGLGELLGVDAEGRHREADP